MTGRVIKIVESVYTKLAKPKLAPGQKGIDGNLSSRLFKNNPAYIKPNKQLLFDAQVCCVSCIVYIIL